MECEWDAEHLSFRHALRGFIHGWRTPEILAEYAATYAGGGELIGAFHCAFPCAFHYAINERAAGTRSRPRW